MYNLYKMERPELMQWAAMLAECDLEVFDPYTDQQLRDFIVDRAVFSAWADFKDSRGQ